MNRRRPEVFVDEFHGTDWPAKKMLEAPAYRVAHLRISWRKYALLGEIR